MTNNKDKQRNKNTFIIFLSLSPNFYFLSMTTRLLECVPNFSEGRDATIIQQITDEIRLAEGVQLLDVAPGKSTNRTVVTFVGTPEAVVKAAFNAIKKAAELIDMSQHSGEHPRMGATDVCPLIPISGISMEETAQLAHQLAERVSRELNIPTYLYEAAATRPERRNLADVRSGEYEGLPQKIVQPEWLPDYGAPVFNPRAGATIIGARDFLVAYNVNLNTTSVRRANSVAFDVREQGRLLPHVADADGNPTRQAGTCKAVKAIGWYIEEYGVAQISMNLTNINITPLHVAFEECCKSAARRGLRVTGSELVGMIPKSVLTDAGRYFLQQQKVSQGVAEAELIRIAVRTLGLSEFEPFDAQKKIIEYRLAEAQTEKLLRLHLRAFADETASESPAPGGGSVAAYVGALGASLATMVANLSAAKRGWDDQLAAFSAHATLGQQLKDELLTLVEEDTRAFEGIMTAFALPKNSESDKRERKNAIQLATKHAIEVPLRVMKRAMESFALIKNMAAEGNPNSVSDAGVAALCARAAVRGAFLNVKINTNSLSDQDFVADVLQKGAVMVQKADELEREILAIVATKM